MSPARMERVESAVRVVAAFVDDFNRHDTAGMLRYLDETCSLEIPAPMPLLGSAGRAATDPVPGAAPFSGKADAERLFAAIFGGSPGVTIEVEELFGAGFRSVLRWNCGWTDQDGGRSLRGVSIFKMKNGLIGEILSYRSGV